MWQGLCDDSSVFFQHRPSLGDPIAMMVSTSACSFRGCSVFFFNGTTWQTSQGPVWPKSDFSSNLLVVQQKTNTGRDFQLNPAIIHVFFFSPLSVPSGTNGTIAMKTNVPLKKMWVLCNKYCMNFPWLMRKSPVATGYPLIIQIYHEHLFWPSQFGDIFCSPFSIFHWNKWRGTFFGPRLALLVS